MIIELAEQILTSITANLTTLKDGSAYDIVNVLTPEFALDPIIFLEKGKEGIGSACEIRESGKDTDGIPSEKRIDNFVEVKEDNRDKRIQG